MRTSLAAVLSLFALLVSACPAQTISNPLPQGVLAYTTPLAATNDKVRTLGADFARLLALTPGVEPVRLVVGSYAGLASAFPERIVLVSASLVDMAEEPRLFILAHELGHVLLDNQRINGKTKSEHKKEFDADAFAADCLKKLKLSIAAGIVILEARSGDDETDFHPAMRDRLARLAQYREGQSGAIHCGLN